MSEKPLDKTVRFAIVGVGNMGSAHIELIKPMQNVELVGVCDVSRARARTAAEAVGCKAYTSAEEMFTDAKPDAVLISTPHYYHIPLSIEAFKHGIHVLVEKPLAVEGVDARRGIAAYEDAQKKHPNLQYGAMFNQRTYGHWRKIKDLVDSGELGRLVRATWIITDWFRTQRYYDTGGWRATWAGEGGGVLLNQCPHNLDLYQWFFGMPERIRGMASLGKYHQIEVEDEVTAYFEHENGMVGHFITTTGESPGTNRLEIVGEQGKLVFENGVLQFQRNRTSMLELLRTSEQSFTKTESWPATIPYTDHGEGGHRIVTERFIEAIRGNAIMLSSFQGNTVSMPMDESAYLKQLNTLKEGSKYDPAVDLDAEAPENLSGTY